MIGTFYNGQHYIVHKYNGHYRWLNGWIGTVQQIIEVNATYEPRPVFLCANAVTHKTCKYHISDFGPHMSSLVQCLFAKKNGAAPYAAYAAYATRIY